MTTEHAETRAIATFVGAFVLLAVASSSIGASRPVMLLNENQILYVFSTAAQVVAGIFGLVITGYIFLRSELDRQKQGDDTVAETIDRIKSEYFGLTIYICLVSVTTILLCLISISVEDPFPHNATAWLINTSLSLFCTNLLSFVYFIVDILNPRKIEEVSNSIKKELAGGESADDKGSLEAFLTTFNRIDQALDSYRKTHLSESKEQPEAHLGNRKVIEILFYNEVIDADTKDGLLKVVKFRNSLLHSSDFHVNRRMVHIATKMHDKLTEALSTKLPQQPTDLARY
jgi:uncharacterized protein YutE (UPF0331/DUF86 family)